MVGLIFKLVSYIRPKAKYAIITEKIRDRNKKVDPKISSTGYVSSIHAEESRHIRKGDEQEPDDSERFGGSPGYAAVKHCQQKANVPLPPLSRLLASRQSSARSRITFIRTLERPRAAIGVFICCSHDNYISPFGTVVDALCWF